MSKKDSIHTTKCSVFDDLGFDSAESCNLKIRAALMREIEKYIQEQGLTQKHAAEIFGITQPRVSDLVNGKINLFTIDNLVIMLSKVNIPVSLVIDDRLAA